MYIENEEDLTEVISPGYIHKIFRKSQIERLTRSVILSIRMQPLEPVNFGSWDLVLARQGGGIRTRRSGPA